MAVRKRQECEHHRWTGRYGNRGGYCGLTPAGLGLETCGGDEARCYRPGVLATARELAAVAVERRN